MKYNYDKVIVEMETLTIYDFVYENEAEAVALQRAKKYYSKQVAEYEELYMKDNSDYWEFTLKQARKKLAAGCKIMSYEQFKSEEKNKLLSDNPKEIDQEEYESMLNILPPLFLTKINGIEMFCMIEMYSSTYTTQYAHDMTTNKYYSKMVDCKDKSTWLNHYLVA